jgi:coiled-coil domain-containing protein 61
LSGNLWRGDFQSKYIEEITAKTGYQKKFNVFVKMLLSALRCENDNVYIDLLTYSDLE